MDFGMLDTNREARFESMRRQSRSAAVFRRHEELRKQCEKEVRLYEKAKRLMNAECKRSQMQCMDRLKTLDHYCPTHLKYKAKGNNFDHVKGNNYNNFSSHLSSKTNRSGSEMRRAAVVDSPPDRSRFSDRMAASADGTGHSRFVSGVTRLSDEYAANSGGDETKGKSGNKEKFLFRVLYRNGKELYIRDEEKALESRKLLNYVDVASNSKPRRSRSYHL